MNRREWCRLERWPEVKDMLNCWVAEWDAWQRALSTFSLGSGFFSGLYCETNSVTSTHQEWLFPVDPSNVRLLILVRWWKCNTSSLYLVNLFYFKIIILNFFLFNCKLLGVLLCFFFDSDFFFFFQTSQLETKQMRKKQLPLFPPKCISVAKDEAPSTKSFLNDW